jgi:hypothetical protein
VFSSIVSMVHPQSKVSAFNTKVICRENIIQSLHFIECNMMCYGALKSNTDQAVNIAFQCSITHHIAQNEVL